LIPTVFGFINVLISFWGQKVKGKLTQQACEHPISETDEGNFTQFWSQMYFGS